MDNRTVDLTGYDRRLFLKLAGYGTLGLIADGIWPRPSRSALGQRPEAVPGAEFSPDLDISLTSGPDEVAVFPGASTRVWRYHSFIHKGDKGRVLEIPGSYVGPIIKVRRGEKIRIRFTNTIPEKSIVHWHGLHVPAIMDGHPRHVIPQGQSYL